MKKITRQDMVENWGNPCDLYSKGCAVCEAWNFWEITTGEKIEYQGHDVGVCVCGSCSEETRQGMNGAVIVSGQPWHETFSFTASDRESAKNCVTVSGGGTVTFRSAAFEKFVGKILDMAEKSWGFNLDFEKHLEKVLDSYNVTDDMHDSLDEEIFAENKEWLAEYIGIANYKRD